MSENALLLVLRYCRGALNQDWGPIVLDTMQTYTEQGQSVRRILN